MTAERVLRRARPARSSSTDPRNVTRSATPDRSASRLHVLALRAVAGDDQPESGSDVGHRADDQIDTLHRFEPPDREHVVAVRARLEPAGQPGRMIQRLGREAVEFCEPGGRVPRVGEERAGIRRASRYRGGSACRAGRRRARCARSRCTAFRTARRPRGIDGSATRPCWDAGRSRSETSTRSADRPAGRCSR